jgi:hypothetical protein
VPDSPFIDRQQEIQEIVRLLKLGQSIAVVGPPGIGKTALLRHLTSPAILGPHQTPSQQLTPIWFDCETLADVSQSDFYEALMQQYQQVAVGELVLSPTGPVGFRHVRRWARQVQQSGAQLIIVLDHFERLARNPLLDANFFGGLRSLATGFDVSYLTTSRLPLSDLPYADPQVIGSPFFNIFRKITLGPLNQAESRQMVSQLTMQADATLPDEIVTFVCTLAEGRPAHLELAAQLALEHWWQNEASWQETDYGLVAQQLREVLEKD